MKTNRLAAQGGTLSILCLVGLLFGANPAFAQNSGNSDGGGGRGVICTGSHGKKTTQLLDYAEAEGLAVTLDLGPAGLSYQERIKYVLNRFKKVDPLFAGKIQQRADAFLSEAAFLVRNEIPEIADLGPTLTPRGCQELQIAVDHCCWRKKRNFSGLGIFSDFT